VFSVKLLMRCSKPFQPYQYCGRYQCISDKSSRKGTYNVSTV